MQKDTTLLLYALAITEQKKWWELLTQKFDWFQTLHNNNSQQHTTTCNRVCKWMQHPGNNIGSCWPIMLCLSAGGFTVLYRDAHVNHTGYKFTFSHEYMYNVPLWYSNVVSPCLKNTDTSNGSKDTLTYFLLLSNTDISIIMDSWALSKFCFLRADADTLKANILHLDQKATKCIGHDL